MNYQLITSDTHLAAYCGQVTGKPYLALDTEFVRIRTYYPHLGLVQLYDGEHLALVDPLGITDWTPLKTLLAAPDMIKYLHAGSEDIEVFFNSMGCVPQPLVDTQVLAAFTGHPLSCGFATLVETYLGVALDKSESRTDWLARPLTEKQCEYAAADVYYLLPLAEKLTEKVRAAGYLASAEEECAMMAQRRITQTDPAEAYRDFSGAAQLRPQQLACLQKLAQWRLEQARQRDMAVNFVVREEHLWKVARYMPTSLGELDGLGLTGQEIRCHGRRLLALTEESRALNEADYPAPVENVSDHPLYRKTFKAIKARITELSEAEQFSPELLASRRQINQYLNKVWGFKTSSEEPELLNGWRKPLLETALAEVVAGIEVSAVSGE